MSSEAEPLPLPDPSLPLPAPIHDSAPELFMECVREHPDQVAISGPEGEWTYATLAQAVCSVGDLLLQHGFQSGDVVALEGPRNARFVAALLATLAYGGILLTLDPSLPPKRHETLVEEAKAKFLLKPSSLTKADSPKRSGSPGVRSIQLGDLEGQNRRVTIPDSLSNLRGRAAYIFYTSGTTGSPNAVVGTHSGLSHFLVWQRDTFGIGHRDRCGQLTHESFDVLLRDILLPLVSCATLCIPEHFESDDQVFPWIERSRVSALHLVPSLAEYWLSAHRASALNSNLRYAFFAGESLSDRLVNRWRSLFGDGCEVVNLYGPTETTLAKCFYRVPSPPRPGIQPIGQALPDTQILLLSDEMKLCGPDEVGQVFIRTPFRTFGYLNNSNEMSRRFLINPFRNDSEDLIFQTGDAARYSADGSLEILGRLDHQVKVLGVRVEPDEIAAVLALHNFVESCIVLPRPSETGGIVFVAYVVPSPRQVLDIDDLRSLALERLPPTLVPARIVLLERLPLMSNGKVDRRALGELDPGPRPFVGPQDYVQESVGRLWAELLDRTAVGIYDNFFELGGHSLIATRMLSRIRREFGVSVSVRSLFENPEVSQFAEIIRSSITQGSKSSVSISRRSRKTSQ